MDWLLPLLAAPFVGSFLGVLVRRLPAGRLLTPARSCCEACGAPIEMRDLVPLASFVALHGRCRACAAPIDPQHWHIELAAVAVAASAALAGLPWTGCVFGWAALALAWIDWEHLLLPDALTLPLVLAGLGATAWLQPWMVTDHAVAAALGYLALQALAVTYRWWRGRDGLGGGDAKFLAAIGAWMGLERLSPVLIGAALLGLVAAAALRARGARMDGAMAIPFGTCLAAAAWVVLLAG